MFAVPEPLVMNDVERADARRLLERWCANEIPAGWVLARPGVLVGKGKQDIVVHRELGLIDVGWGIAASPIGLGGRLPPTPMLHAVTAAIQSVDAGLGPALARTLERALDDGDALRGVIARAVDASNSTSGPEAAMGEMLAVLLDTEPAGGDERIDELLELRGIIDAADVRTDAGDDYAARLREMLSTDQATWLRTLLVRAERERDDLRSEVARLRAALADGSADHVLREVPQ